MAGDSEWEELRNEAKVYSTWAACSLLEGVFLTTWLFVQWLIGKAVALFELEDVIDRSVLWAFQILFAVSTLVPVVVYIYTDTRILLLRARRRIQLEMESTRESDSDGQ